MTRTEYKCTRRYQSRQVRCWCGLCFSVLLTSCLPVTCGHYRKFVYFVSNFTDRAQLLSIKCTHTPAQRAKRRSEHFICFSRHLFFLFLPALCQKIFLSQKCCLIPSFSPPVFDSPFLFMSPSNIPQCSATTTTASSHYVRGPYRRHSHCSVVWTSWSCSSIDNSPAVAELMASTSGSVFASRSSTLLSRIHQGTRPGAAHCHG